MGKLNIICAVLALIPVPMMGAAPQLEGQPFIPTWPLVWAATATNLPATVMVYKVLPQQFSSAVISNILAIASFTPVTMAESADKSVMHWEYRDERKTLLRSLDISPVYGMVNYQDYRAVDTSTNGDRGVPSRKEVETLAFNYLQAFGGDKNQLCVSSHSGTERNHGRFDKVTKQMVSHTVMRGVMYARQLDGIRFLGAGGRGGFAMDFARDGKISLLQLDWRNIRPYRRYPTLTPDEILAQIKAGKAVHDMYSDESPQKPDTLTVTKITPYYLSAPSGAPEDFILAYGDVEIRATVNATNEVMFHLNCPIFKADPDLLSK